VSNETPDVPAIHKIKGKATAGQVQPQETARNVWIFRPTEDITKEDMLRPAFWTHVARLMRVNDRIEVLSQDASWYAELIVRAVGPLEVATGLLAFTQFDAIAAPSEDEYTVAWKGPTAKWRITRVADKLTLREGFSSEAAAKAWLATPLSDREAA
jgi:hypothetical protein